MTSSKRSGLLLVALVPNLLAPRGEELLELAGRLEGRRLGRCVFIEADMDALALLDEAERLGAESIVLVGPGPWRGLERVEPTGGRGLDPQRLVRELWMNLTGSLGLDDYAAALRILSERPFYVVGCGDSCRGAVARVLEGLCGADAGEAGL